MVKEKKNKTITIRVSENDLRYFKVGCYMTGSNPSKFLRMMMDSVINGVKVAEQKGEVNIEDIEKLLND